MDYLSSTTALIIFVSSVVIGVFLHIKAYGGKMVNATGKCKCKGHLFPYPKRILKKRRSLSSRSVLVGKIVGRVQPASSHQTQSPHGFHPLYKA